MFDGDAAGWVFSLLCLWEYFLQLALRIYPGIIQPAFAGSSLVAFPHKLLLPVTQESISLCKPFPASPSSLVPSGLMWYGHLFWVTVLQKQIQIFHNAVTVHACRWLSLSLSCLCNVEKQTRGLTPDHTPTSSSSLSMSAESCLSHSWESWAITFPPQLCVNIDYIQIFQTLTIKSKTVSCEFIIVWDCPYRTCRLWVSVQTKTVTPEAQRTKSRDVLNVGRWHWWGRHQVAIYGVEHGSREDIRGETAPGRRSSKCKDAR